MARHYLQDQVATNLLTHYLQVNVVRIVVRRGAGTLGSRVAPQTHPLQLSVGGALIVNILTLDEDIHLYSTTSLQKLQTRMLAVVMTTAGHQPPVTMTCVFSLHLSVASF